MPDSDVLVTKAQMKKLARDWKAEKGGPINIKRHMIAWTPAKIAGQWIWGKRITRRYVWLVTTKEYASAGVSLGWN